MSYLKLIEDKIQNFAESLSSILNIDITVVDNNLLRIAGTGDFHNRINENSPENSLFSRILKDGIKNKEGIYEKNDHICLDCKYLDVCREKSNIAFPIIVDNEIIGISSFATFDTDQDIEMITKKYRYIEFLKYFTSSIEKEIVNIKTLNKLNSNIAEVNTIINYIDKGIIIVNDDNEITNINSKAISTLKLNISKSNIINKKINNIISNIKLKNTENKLIKSRWTSFDNVFEVVYKIDNIVLNGYNISSIINFDLFDNKLKLDINDTLSYDSFDRIIGKSREITKVIQTAKIISKSDSTVLLSGESGTGKELFAKAIHNSSDRAGGEFIAVNCSALPETLIESELFGYEKGSFTGANLKGKKGKFELANNGTIFLDEIADISLFVQSKLLRVIQERKIDKVGGSKPIDINVRIIAATHKNLLEMVHNNQFREDLYYRLNVIPIEIPPLRNRDEDVLHCAEFIIITMCNKIGKSKKILSSEVIDLFLKYDWPGNIRELENVLEYSINFSQNEYIGLDNLPNYFFNNIENSIYNRINNYSNLKINRNNFTCLDEMTKEYEKYILNEYINLYGNSLEGKSKIAEKLNISLTTLYRKINDS